MVSDVKGLGSRETASTRQGQAERVRSEARRETPAARSEPTRDDTVELSSLSEALRAAATALAAEPSVDEARVRDIRDALANGDYAMDPDRIARKLIDQDNL